MSGMMNGTGMMGSGFCVFLGILIILAIIAVVVWMRRGTGTNHSSQSSSSHSLEILKERLAKGEISEEEYDHLKRKLDEQG
ncbi:SHOCT domain-containing protein [Salibacterium halotolerans]|uniref:Putative membrane protein n=1 Tax=Salibacterium halotolerans TaxID=1884432 RepID=A0A1I5UQ37_9BACI|nr:SHOCT domain-containing protein [Salibacterium halotolerans]SFP97381.1 putative membrane protein [Salibacterium halotolerans]